MNRICSTFIWFDNKNVLIVDRNKDFLLVGVLMGFGLYCILKEQGSDIVKKEKKKVEYVRDSKDVKNYLHLELSLIHICNKININK